MEEVNTSWRVEERPFTSAVPLLGPLVVALRRLWNGVSTRWYVHQLVEQQNRYNMLVVQLLNEMRELLDWAVARAEESQLRHDRSEERLTHVEHFGGKVVQRIEEAEGRAQGWIKEMEEILSNQIREAEAWLIQSEREQVGLTREASLAHHRLSHWEREQAERLAELEEKLARLRELMEQMGRR